MIPAIMRKEMARLMPAARRRRRACGRSDKEVGRHHRLHLGDRGLRRLLHPEELRHLDRLTGGPQAALWGFLVFYLSCIAITWWFYTRRGGLLRDIERGGPSPSARAPAAQPAE